MSAKQKINIERATSHNTRLRALRARNLAGSAVHAVVDAVNEV
eukprot:CAMPEP_0183542202 /NCGR_PEP_ID=MMETSP0371-20130417/42237_1 /TAXON_ID=268820 /ORGANISM="Peridinium aciculiferum, Strain PAER-2" /LENGTH=42 /DNA_ID= /DNA_START= /DNA_END= /DNA_ORIENTATION=